jgi:hypothetical protein
LSDNIGDDVVDAYELGVTASKIADSLQFDLFTDLIPELTSPLEAAFNEAGEDAFGTLDITEEKLFGLVHEDARVFAESRAAELVGKRIVNGVVIDNPDARWAITDSTRDGLRSLVESAYKDGLSPDKLKTAIQEAYGFSRQRAKLIAKTETAKASVQGTMAGWKRSGMVEGKSSLLSDDHDFDDECNDNEDVGVIALDEDFPSGDDGPPYHPGCNCSLVAELIPQGEENEDTE